MKIEDILKSFEIYDKEYKRNAVDAALAQREEIIPHLIAVLEDAFNNPEKFTNRDNPYFSHIYAFMLLGHFCEEKAHDALVKLFSLPDELPSALFGDFITEDLPIVLFRTCGGNPEKIKELILNKDAYEYCRGAALEALSYTYIEGYITREVILSFYQELFDAKETDPESAFYAILAGSVCDIYPEELHETVKTAYDAGLIDSWHIKYEEFVEVLEQGKEKCINNFRAKIQNRQIDNIHDSMSWWACFKQPQKSSPKNVPINFLENKEVFKNKPKSKSNLDGFVKSPKCPLFAS
jgi:hypothetical protein